MNALPGYVILTLPVLFNIDVGSRYACRMEVGRGG